MSDGTLIVSPTWRALQALAATFLEAVQPKLAEAFRPSRAMRERAAERPTNQPKQDHAGTARSLGDLSEIRSTVQVVIAHCWEVLTSLEPTARAALQPEYLSPRTLAAIQRGAPTINRRRQSSPGLLLDGHALVRALIASATRTTHPFIHVGPDDSLPSLLRLDVRDEARSMLHEFGRVYEVLNEQMDSLLAALNAAEIESDWFQAVGELLKTHAPLLDDVEQLQSLAARFGHWLVAPNRTEADIEQAWSFAEGFMDEEEIDSALWSARVRSGLLAHGLNALEDLPKLIRHASTWLKDDPASAHAAAQVCLTTLKYADMVGSTEDGGWTIDDCAGDVIEFVADVHGDLAPCLRALFGAIDNYGDASGTLADEIFAFVQAGSPSPEEVAEMVLVTREFPQSLFAKHVGEILQELLDEES